MDNTRAPDRPMTATYTIGCDVHCSDGAVGTLTRIVVDPIKRSITHLVVTPRRHREHGHLIPLSTVANSGPVVQLRCTTAELANFDDAVETEFLPGDSGLWGYQPDQILSWPYYGLDMEGLRMGGVGALGGNVPTSATYDRVPDGEVEVRRGEPVHASDGDIGRVQGLVVDRVDHAVTHVLVDEGHLWGEKRLAIPISAVIDVNNGVNLDLTKRQVRELPPVAIG
jgi:sporulation protein YlmC with PRC-barrel domain